MGPLTPQQLHIWLHDAGVSQFYGVPDSIISPFSFYLEENHSERHVITANEGNAIGLAIGYNIATRGIPLVYMQNSGLGNAADPLVSLADQTVLGIPMLLLVSWRGEPGTNDEPQHQKQGAITSKVLETLGIPFDTLSSNKTKAEQQITQAVQQAKKLSQPVALVLSKGILGPYEQQIIKTRPKSLLSREEALAVVLKLIDGKTAVVSGIGKVSRELFELRAKSGLTHASDLHIVGGMGHASSVALSIAQNKPDRMIICLDGDGSALMHMGSLATVGTARPTKFCHIVFNNHVHDSVGGQPTTAPNVDWCKIAKACGYANVSSAKTEAEITSALSSQQGQGPYFIEIRVRPGARANLGRPATHPKDNKQSFQEFLH